MKTLAELLSEKVTEAATKAADGGGSGNWENLPLDREFRVKVIEAGVSKTAAGVARLDLTLSVIDPGTKWDGRRIWNSWFHTDYDFQLEQLASLYVALGLTGADIPQSNDYEVIFSAIAPKIVERTLIIACRNQQGTDGVSRTKVRWTNPDSERGPRQSIKPPKDSQKAPDLTVDVTSVIRTNPEPFPAAPAAPQANVPPSSGIRLPTR